MIRAGDRGEVGAVAVVVALVVTLVLLPVAALALDLGNTYTLTAALQRAADEAAVAGAQALAVAQRTATPSAATQQAAMAQAAAAAIAVLCADPLLGDGSAQAPWRAPCTDHDWAFDHDLDPNDPTRHPDGEIEFYAGPADAPGHRFAVSQLVTGGDSRLVTGIRVQTPPATVRYGIATLFGASSGSAQRASTAELRTVLPTHDANGTSGQKGSNLPLYLTTHDQGGAWCARSAPRESWRTSTTTESNHPTGTACDPTLSPSVPRGYLTATEQVLPPQPGTSVQLEPQRWPQVARLRALTPYLFGTGGRLVQSGCPGGNSASTGGYSRVESSYLGDFVNTAVGTADALKTMIMSRAVPGLSQQGWLSPDILRCGRLALVPVLNLPAPPDQPSGPDGHHYGLTTTTYQVQALRLVWLDDVFAANDLAPIAGTSTASTCLQRGFYWENAYVSGYCPRRDDTDAPLRAITGYVIDPALLPATVAGPDAANTTSFLGSGLPATVRLVHDIGDPPAT